MRKTTIAILASLLAIQGAVAASSRRSADEYWWLCPVDRSRSFRPEYSSDKTEPGSIEARADSVRIVDRELTHFVGDVELVKDDTAMRADEITHDQVNDSLSAEGHSEIWDSTLFWQGERALFNLRDDLTRLEQGRYWLLGRQGRGAADIIKNNSRENVSRLVNVDYTTCPAASEVWKFSAAKIKLDHNTERGYATNALLKVRGVPVFYIPYINFPLSDKRKSGFLTPTIGTTNESGADVQVPYYINIAPNQDATFAPRWIDSRGQMFAGEYRYMGRTFKSEFDFEYLPGDDLANGDDRSSFSLKHEQYYAGKHGYINALLQNVSDAQYFEDFGHSLSVTSERYLDRRIETRFAYDWLWLYGMMQSYQSIDDSIPDEFGPYKRLPQILAQTQFLMRHLRPHLYTLTELTYFDRGDSVTGGRIDIQPTVSLPFIKPWAFIRPALGVKYTNYLLTESGQFDTQIHRAVPVLSVDSQLFMERRFEWFGSRLLQTLEPRAYYLLVPKTGQDDIPIFDSGDFDFSFINLFRDNRFAGRDRVGDANQLALAVTSRYLSLESGREVFHTSLGQIYYFRPQEITLPGAAVVDDSTSEFIAEVAANVTDSWSTRATLQWDPHDNQTEKSALGVRYAPRDGMVLNAAYRLRRAVTDIEQTDLSFRVPMTENLSLIGRWNYSLQSEQSLELVGGIEYESCCWGIRIVSRRFIRNTEGEFDNALFMQAEFKGLGGFGRSASSFLRRNIPGYEPHF